MSSSSGTRSPPFTDGTHPASIQVSYLPPPRRGRASFLIVSDFPGERHPSPRPHPQPLSQCWERGVSAAPRTNSPSPSIGRGGRGVRARRLVQRAILQCLIDDGEE